MGIYLGSFKGLFELGGSKSLPVQGIDYST